MAADEKASKISLLEGVKAEDRVYLDEMGCAANMTLECGRSRQGERLYDANPTAPGVTVNTAAALTETGVKAVFTYTGNLDAELFICYLHVCILKLLAGGKVRKFKPRFPCEIANTIQSAIKAVTEDDAISYINHAEELL